MALGQLVEGKWLSKPEQEDSKGRFLRPSTTFRDRLAQTVPAASKQSQVAIISISVRLVLGRIKPQLCES